MRLMAGSHRRRGRDKTVLSCPRDRVGGVNKPVRLDLTGVFGEQSRGIRRAMTPKYLLALK